MRSDRALRDVVDFAALIGVWIVLIVLAVLMLPVDAYRWFRDRMSLRWWTERELRRIDRIIRRSR